MRGIQVFIALALGVATLWGALALRFQLDMSRIARWACITLWVSVGAVLVVLVCRGNTGFGAGGFGVLFVLLLVWWVQRRPSNDRLWADDVAEMTSGRTMGSQLELHHVRNFAWRTQSDYMIRWETRRFDLQRLESVDLVLSYWTIRPIAHVLVSFGFGDGQYVTFSVEIRRRRGHGFSAIGGFFKEFELSILAADERDVIRVRTNVRREEDYLYRLRLPRESMRSLLLAYVTEANALLHQPRFYNTLTVNCTTLVYHMMNHIVGHLPWDIRLLLSGYLPSYVHKLGGLDSRFTLDELQRMGRITERARAADTSSNFSADIRQDIPILDDR